MAKINLNGKEIEVIGPVKIRLGKEYDCDEFLIPPHPQIVDLEVKMTPQQAWRWRQFVRSCRGEDIKMPELPEAKA